MTPRESKRIWNPPDPYTSESREYLDEPEAATIEVYEDRSRTILSENRSPDVGFRYSVNPYRGCQHACTYCYARPTHEYLGLGAGTDFDRKILVKRDAPNLLDAAFRRRSWQGHLVAFSGVTDCYQPLEASYRLTRGCLEVCLEFRNPVEVVTKSALIRRDVDILARLAEEAGATVFFSIPFLDGSVGRKIEPGAPSPERRFETMHRLRGAGVPVGVAISPVIPGLNDSDIPGILERARECGATRAFYLMLRLPGSTRDVFLRHLEIDLPDRARRIENRIREIRGGRMNDPRFGQRHRGSGPYWEAIDQTFRMSARRLGYDSAPRDEPGPSPAFRRPPREGDQTHFNW